MFINKKNMETLIALSDYETERNKPMPSKNHSRVARRLNVLLTPFEDKYDIMNEICIEFDPKDSVPDLCLYPKLSFDWENDEISMTETPITTFEILSPSQAINDLVKKIRNIYFPAGIKSSWLIVPPLKTVHILYPNTPTQTFSEGNIKDLVTNVEIKLEDIFR